MCYFMSILQIHLFFCVTLKISCNDALFKKLVFILLNVYNGAVVALLKVL